MSIYSIYCDSSIRPFNPFGILTYAFIVKSNYKIVHQEANIIGFGKPWTNNIGEMSAVLAAMRWLVIQSDEPRPTIVNSDSQLVVDQCNEYKGCHDPMLYSRLQLIKEAARRYPRSVRFNWIPREKNKEADALSRTPYTQKMLDLMRANENNITFDWDDVPW